MHIARIAEVARDPKSHTNYKFLGLAHMQDIACTYTNQLNDLKLQVSRVQFSHVLTNSIQGLNNLRKYISTLTQLDDYHRLLMVVSENDIP
jgi:hypothetical protein